MFQLISDLITFSIFLNNIIQFLVMSSKFWEVAHICYRKWPLAILSIRKWPWPIIAIENDPGWHLALKQRIWPNLSRLFRQISNFQCGNIWLFVSSCSDTLSDRWSDDHVNTHGLWWHVEGRMVSGTLGWCLVNWGHSWCLVNRDTSPPDQSQPPQQTKT